MGLMILLAGCARESLQADNVEFDMTLTAVPFPALVGDSRLVIHITDLGGNPINDAQLKIKADMTHAGMIPVLAEQDGGGQDGYYKIPFSWTMGGDWVVSVEARLPDAAVIEKRFDVAVGVEEKICTYDHEAQ